MSAYSAAVLADSPLRYYRLDEAPGATSVADSSGHSATGTVSATGVTLGTAGVLLTDPTDTAAAFNGTSGTISIPVTGLPTAAQPFSLEAWLTPATIAPGAQIALSLGTWGAGAAASYLILKGASLYLANYGDGVDAGPYTVAAGVTYHVVGTYDGVNTRLYVNGALVATSVAGTLATGATAAYIANAPETPLHDLYSGVVDEAAIYGVALSATRVLAHYQAAVTFSPGGAHSAGQGGATAQATLHYPTPGAVTVRDAAALGSVTLSDAAASGHVALSDALAEQTGA